tara:strand:+ start:830 stop:1438 length:609 start_codon:yes stop_codon:yes gene_type:complete
MTPNTQAWREILFENTKIPKGLLPKNIDNLPNIDTSWDKYHKNSCAVCLIFIPGTNGAEIILTKRSNQVRTHKGQIGFPGGRRDPQDKSPTQTAFRETEEEIGIPTAALSPHYQLATAYGVEGQSIIPIVASTDMDTKKININQNEVASIILMPWTNFYQSCASKFDFKLFGKLRESYLYEVSAHRIWGITARILFNANLKS